MKPFISIMAAFCMATLSSAVVHAGDDAAALKAYRQELARFRAEFGGSFNIPDTRFFLFGMGLRTKYLYRDGVLSEALTGKPIRTFALEHDEILPPEYRVDLKTRGGKPVSIVEDEQGVWLSERGQRQRLPGTERTIKLPDFVGQAYPNVLRVLHQELLINILPQGPVPNLFVYATPWYRDGAMMAMCFEKTGNLEQIRPWIESLREPYDRNNAGETEADNLGQALYLVSLISDKNHPLVSAVLAQVPKFEVKHPAGPYIKGRSDFSEHPVYQTKWLKYGLRALGLPDPYVIPHLADDYSALFWMDYRQQHVPGQDADDRTLYPYLGWASDHFHGVRKSPISNREYPLTWEGQASQAKYAGIAPVSSEYAKQQVAAPHTWHAAEIFLYLLE